jgi:hypothetical protein
MSQLNNAYSDLDDTILDYTVPKITSYDAIIIETNRLLQREHSLFFINSIITIGLVITVFNVI